MSRYVLIGGFLGAGKSTAIARLSRFLEDRGETVGLVTNDQSGNLVDTEVARADGRAVEEIGDGCFCCRFDSLIEASRRLERDFHPSVVVAEPVGCCTDLVATVSYPLHRHHGEEYVLAPFSVLVDPVRARRVLELEEGDEFSEDVDYIYRKQLEEAHVIVINKSDSMAPRALSELENVIRERFPNAVRFIVSARRGVGLEPWFEHLMAEEIPEGIAMTLDYDRYASGEARLGRLNCAASVESPRERGGYDGNRFLEDVAGDLLRQLRDSRREVAHCKMTLSPRDRPDSVALLNLVATGREPELARRLDGPLTSAGLILNLRAEASPEFLREAVVRALRSTPDRMVSISRLDSFQPARPQPRHRLLSLTAG